MKFPLIVGFICLIFTTCSSPEAPKPFTGDKTFYTAAPNLLYFKNVRSAYYYRSRKPNSKKDLYDFRKFEKTTSRPILYPTIVNNWLEDESYIFLERNRYPYFADSLVLHVGLSADSSATKIRMTVPSKKAQYEMATEIYESMRKGKALSVLTKNQEWVPIFREGSDRTNFMIVMKDYLKLTSGK